MNINLISAIIVPVTLAAVGAYGLYKKTDVFGALLAGAADGLQILAKILPSLVALFCAIYMLRASGALDFICRLLAPFTGLIGIPEECSPLLLLRPLSGGAALAMGSDIIQAHGADSYTGRVAAVMLGASETTFYTIAIYFGAVKVNKTRYAIPAALIADAAGFIAAAAAVRLFWG